MFVLDLLRTKISSRINQKTAKLITNINSFYSEMKIIIHAPKSLVCGVTLFQVTKFMYASLINLAPLVSWMSVEIKVVFGQLQQVLILYRLYSPCDNISTDSKTDNMILHHKSLIKSCNEIWKSRVIVKMDQLAKANNDANLGRSSSNAL